MYDTIPTADATGIADIKALLKPEAIIAALSGTNNVYELLGEPIPFKRFTKFFCRLLLFNQKNSAMISHKFNRLTKKILFLESLKFSSVCKTTKKVIAKWQSL